MKSSIVLLVIFVLGANESYAATGSTGYVDIQTIRVGGGFLRVTGITDFIDPSNCNGSGANANRNIVVLEGAPSYKEILSFVLSAKMTNRAIQFWVDGCATDSGNLYPNAKYVYVQQDPHKQLEGLKVKTRDKVRVGWTARAQMITVGSAEGVR